MFAGIAVAFAAALAWQLLHLFWLDALAAATRQASPTRPTSSGIWGDVVSQVVRLHRRKRFHKERLLQVFRELRQLDRRDARWRAHPQLRSGEIAWFNRTAARLLELQAGKADRWPGVDHEPDPRAARWREYLQPAPTLPSPM